MYRNTNYKKKKNVYPLLKTKSEYQNKLIIYT